MWELRTGLLAACDLEAGLDCLDACMLVVEALSTCLLLSPSQRSLAAAGMLRHQEAVGAA